MSLCDRQTFSCAAVQTSMGTLHGLQTLLHGLQQCLSASSLRFCCFALHSLVEDHTANKIQMLSLNGIPIVVQVWSGVNVVLLHITQTIVFDVVPASAHAHVVFCFAVADCSTA